MIQVIVFMQLDLGRNQHYTDVCPLLDLPSSGGSSYVHPVHTDRDIELVTRNLRPEVSKLIIAMLLF